MLSKYKSDCQKIDSDSLIQKFYTDSYSIKGVDYDPMAYEPKKDMYSTYYQQNRKNFIFKALTISGLSFVIGCGFGVFMLALQSMGTMGMMSQLDDRRYKYESFKEVRTAIYQTFKNTVYRNGVFMLRFSIAIAVFNAVVTYMPFTQSRFAQFYGYGNLDSIFYFAIPTYVILKFTHCSISKRFAYSTIFASVYTLFKIFYIKEYKEEIKEMYNYIKTRQIEEIDNNSKINKII